MSRFIIIQLNIDIKFRIKTNTMLEQREYTSFLCNSILYSSSSIKDILPPFLFICRWIVYVFVTQDAPTNKTKTMKSGLYGLSSHSMSGDF
jgi:hypothetical protein